MSMPLTAKEQRKCCMSRETVEGMKITSKCIVICTYIAH